MMTAWTNFAKTGDPNGEKLPAWQQFDANTQPTMRFGVDTRLENAPDYEEYLAMVEFRKGFDVFDSLK
jgi:para-nitrobenzyl esterase